MESRREHRVVVAKPIVLTLLCEPEIRLAAIVKDVSPRGIGVVTAERVTPGVAVKIETEDSILLGEATYSRMSEEGCFVGIQLTEVLTGLAALDKMAQEFEAQLRPQPRQVSASAPR